jgi:cytochrome c-type biogenesis protein CcmH
MSERSRNLLIAAALVLMASVTAVLVFTAPSDQDRVARIGASIMCPVCQGEAIASSPAQMARDMMALVEDRVASGASDSEVIDELISSYSGALLLDPPMEGPTLILWLAPLAALIAGLVVIAWWRRHPEAEGEKTAVEPASRNRRAVGALILIGSIAFVAVAVGFFLQERDDPPGGLAAIQVEDLSSVSNQTLEAVIASNQDHDLIDGMRLALGERYLRAGEYRAAFPHYLAVASSAVATRDQVVMALIGLGWMAWDGNAEAGTALGLFDQALELDPASVEAMFLKSRVLACGADSPEEAIGLLESLLNRGDLTDGNLAMVRDELDALRSGTGCT